MKKGITFLLVAAAVVLAAATVYFATRSGGSSGPEEKVYKIGILNGLDYFGFIIDGYKEEMAKLGYVEGENIIYDVYVAPAPVGNQAEIEKFIDEGVDLIMAFPTEASLEAKIVAEGTGTPVVSGTLLLEGNDFAESVSRPGGNVTGVNYGGTGVGVKRLEVLHAIDPEATMILVPYLKDYPTVAPVMESLRQAAMTMGVVLSDAPLSTLEELKAYFDEFPADRRVDAVLQIVEPFSATPEANEIVWRWAEGRDIPVAGALVFDDSYGPILSYVPDSFEMGIMAAGLTDKVLKGVPAGTIPMPTAEGKLGLNMKIAERLGLTVSNDLLSQATEIIR